MMAVICFCLRASEQDRAGALRQLSSYMWEWPPENPLDLGTLYVSEALRSKEKSGILAGPVENSASCLSGLDPFHGHLHARLYAHRSSIAGLSQFRFEIFDQRHELP